MTNNPSMPCRDITELCPTLERACNELLKRCKAAGLNVLITQTYRTAAYQASLYAQGRTKPGSIITNLNGYGNSTSPHQHRIAFDICKNVKGHEYDDYSFFKACGKIWVAMGGTWGGNWTGFVDNPHFEFTDNQGYSPFRYGYAFPDDFRMLWEKEAPKEEEPEMIYNYLDKNMPEWARPTIQKLMDKGYLKGNEKGELGLNDTMLKIFVVNDRAGLYNK